MRELVADMQLLSDEELWDIAKVPLPPQQWRRHQRLLRKAENETLPVAEQEELEKLRAVTDQFVIRRSYALALLKWRGHPGQLLGLANGEFPLIQRADNLRDQYALELENIS